MKANYWVRSRWVLFMALLLAACSTQQPRVHEGRFQKRQHRGGWHVDLGIRSKESTLRQTTFPLPKVVETQIPKAGRREATWKRLAKPKPAMAIPEGAQLAQVERNLSIQNEPIAMVQSSQSGGSLGNERQTNASKVTPASQTQEERPPKVWNKWALPAFILALATVAYGILGTNAVILVIAVVATLVIAAIALRKGRRYEWSGKGFALGAMILGTFAALITLIALLNGRV